MPLEMVSAQQDYILPEAWAMDWQFLKNLRRLEWDSVPGKLYWNGECLSYTSDVMEAKKLKALSFDFNIQWNQVQKQNQRQKRGPLFQAIGKNTLVVDATCGSGKDSLLLVAWNKQVMAFERSPFIFLLLKDALRRAYPLIQQNLSIQWGDVRTHTKDLAASMPQACLYYDPMYPESAREKKLKKGALARKEMEVFREIAHAKAQEDREFLSAALEQNWNRVVVKRPLKTEVLLNRSLPRRKDCYWEVTSFTGKTVRYDRYLRCLI